MEASRELIAEEGDQPRQRHARQQQLPRVTSLVGLAGLCAIGYGVIMLEGSHRRTPMAAPSSALDGEVTMLEEEENPCDKYPYLKYEVPHAVVYNNLANKGPDSGNGEGLVYKTVDLGEGAGDELDREVYMTINATNPDYKPFSPRLNGMQGKYGSINLNSGSSVDLLFNFYDRETMEKLTLPEFAITWFDLDTGDHGTSAEFVTMGGFKSYHVMGETEVKIEKQPDGRTKFTATQVGTGEDNPKDPNFLTAQQKNRAVTFLYGTTESLDVTIGAGSGIGPRFFTFVGRPSLLCATTVQENYKPPLEDLTFEPPMENAVMVKEGETFVNFAVAKGDEVKEGDVIATTKKGSDPPKEYKALHDGTVTKLQDKLKPGEKLDERLSEKIIAVIERPTLEKLPTDDKVVPGGPGEEAKLPASATFKKYLVEVGDEVNKDDPIAVIEKKKGEEEEVKATDCGVVKERQEDMKEGMLLKSVPDANLITLGPIPALPTGPDATAAATVPPEDAEGKTFEKYEVKKGDTVKEGEPVATVKDKDGNEEEVPADKGGIVSDLHDDLKPGTPLDRLEDGNLATVGKFPPLPVEPGQSPVGVEGSGPPEAGEEPAEDGEEPAGAEPAGEEGPTPEPLAEEPPEDQDKIDPEGLKFVKYHVKPGDVVETGDPIAQVEDKDGNQHDIMAPKPGVVKATQDGLKEGMVLDNVMSDSNLATIGKLPPLEVADGEKANFAPEDANWQLKEWKAEVGDEVEKGDPIAILEQPATEEEREVKANTSGKVTKRLDELQPGDVVEQATTDDDLATIEESKGPKIGLLEAGVEVPSMDCTFEDWRVNMGERVHIGDPIADFQCPEEEKPEEEEEPKEEESPEESPPAEEEKPAEEEGRRLARGRRLVEMRKFTAPSPGTGTINYLADLKPGKTIKESDASATIAKVDLGLPWWLGLLGALLLLCCCFCCLFKAMQKPMVYKPMPDPEPEPVAPPPANEGLRLDFEDNGTIRTVYAKYKPLGIHHRRTAPIVVTDFTINSYAKQELGVKPTWKLTRIGDEELNESTDFPDVTSKLYDYMKEFPVWPLPLEFRKSPDDPGTVVHKFTERPLGIEFSNVAPIKVDKVYPNSPAASMNVEPGWFLTRIGDFDVHENHNFREVIYHFKEGVQGLDGIEGADVVNNAKK